MPKSSKTILIIIVVTVLLFLPLLGWTLSSGIPNKGTGVFQDCVISSISENGFTITDETCHGTNKGVRREIIIRFIEENEE